MNVDMGLILLFEISVYFKNYLKLATIITMV